MISAYDAFDLLKNICNDSISSKMVQGFRLQYLIFFTLVTFLIFWVTDSTLNFLVGNEGFGNTESIELTQILHSNKDSHQGSWVQEGS